MAYVLGDVDGLICLVVDLDFFYFCVSQVARIIRLRRGFDRQGLAIEKAGSIGCVSRDLVNGLFAEQICHILRATQHLHRISLWGAEAAGEQTVQGIGHRRDVYRVVRGIYRDVVRLQLGNVACCIHSGPGVDGQFLTIELARDRRVGRYAIGGH